MILPGAAGLTVDQLVHARRRPAIAGAVVTALVVSVGVALYHSAPESRPAPYDRIVLAPAPVAAPAPAPSMAAPIAAVLFSADAIVSTLPARAPDLSSLRTSDTSSVADGTTHARRTRLPMAPKNDVPVARSESDISEATSTAATTATLPPSAGAAMRHPSLPAAVAQIVSPVPLVVVTSPNVDPAPPPTRSFAALPTPTTTTALDADAPQGAKRDAITRFVREIRTRAPANFDLGEFFGEGVEHRVTLRGDVPATGPSTAGTRVSIELHLSKRDAVGRRFTRVLPVSMTVTPHDASPQISAVEFGTLRKP